MIQGCSLEFRYSSSAEWCDSILVISMMVAADSGSEITLIR